MTKIRNSLRFAWHPFRADLLVLTTHCGFHCDLTSINWRRRLGTCCKASDQTENNDQFTLIQHFKLLSYPETVMAYLQTMRSQIQRVNALPLGGLTYLGF